MSRQSSESVIDRSIALMTAMDRSIVLVTAPLHTMVTICGEIHRLRYFGLTGHHGVANVFYRHNDEASCR
ncbi:hypothetical protein HI914_01230 [Erysiphe necator]|nr:hypothetical protein HI914_01230 [Erysiphe necator]